MAAAFINDFVANGFLVERGAVAPDLVRACRNAIENELRVLSVDTHDPATWTEPVVRIPCPDGPAFAAAGTSPALWRMNDALLGPRRWFSVRESEALFRFGSQHEGSWGRRLAHRWQLRSRREVLGERAQSLPR